MRTSDTDSRPTEAVTADVWHGLEQRVTDASINEWRPRFRAQFRARHFERITQSRSLV